jgi:hypothetical protein
MSRILRVTVAALVALVVLAAGQGVAAADNPGAEADFVNRINAARAANGRGGLAVDAELTAIARRWSQQMANAQRLSHNPNLSKEVTQDWEKLAENVGYGQDVAQIHEAFMNSSAHRANILDGALTHVGVGVVVDGGGQMWVTEVFMRLRGGGGSTPTTAAPPPPPPPTTAAPRPTSPPTTRPPRVVTTTTAPPGPSAEELAAQAAAAEAAAAAAAAQAAAEAEAAAAAAAAAATPPPSPTARLILVLDGLRALDTGH